MKPFKLLKRLKDSLTASIDCWKNAALTVTGAVSVFFMISLATNIEYSIQMISSGLVFNALNTRIVDLYLASGNLGIALTVVYSALIGSAITNLYSQIKLNSLSFGNLAGIAPAFLVSGCAGCGLGILAILGFSGALAALPFSGNLVRLGGIGLIIFFLARTGDPKVCEAPDKS